jgi:excisionase family DNA binding protein
MEPYAARTATPAPRRQNLKPASSALPMLTPVHAWRLLCRRTGGGISLTTFYRWINSGRIGVVRVGFRFLIPLPFLEEVIQKCLDGERV